MTLLINLLPYRPATTGLSRYVQRLLAAWGPEPPPLQLRLQACGAPEFSTDPALPQEQRSRRMRWLQGNALVQHGVAVRRLVAALNPDLIYSPYTDRLLALPDVPQVITCHDLTPLHVSNSLKAHLRSRWWLPQHLAGASRVIAISRSVADQLVDTGLPAGRITVVLNGVEPVADPIEAPASRDCLVLARHARNKNVALALEGFHRLLLRCPHWSGQLLVVGAADRCTPQLRRLERQLQLQGRVRWLAELSDAALEQLLRQSFCLLSPSLMEGFDYPLLEAQALGLPTLASRIPVHEELHRECALLFALDDHGDTMAAQILRLERERGLWQQLSRAGLVHARQLTVRRQVGQIQELLRQELPH